MRSSNHCKCSHENFVDCYKFNSAEFFPRKPLHLQRIDRKKFCYNEVMTNDHYNNKFNICKKTIDQIFYHL